MCHKPDKGLNFEGDLDFHTNLVGKKGDELGIWDKAVKKDLTVLKTIRTKILRLKRKWINSYNQESA